MTLFQSNTLNCQTARTSFSDYLDGAVSGRQMQAIAAHLDQCEACRGEFAQWRTLQQTLASLKTAKPPVDLGLRLRLAISHEQAARRSSWRDAFSLAWQNTLRPVALQVAGGVACAIALIGTITLLLGVVPPPNAVLANDEPLGAITAPHYLYSAVSPEPIVMNRDAANSTVVVEALVNADGRVYDYAVVSGPGGPEDPAIRNQIVEHLLLSVFKPASVFGMPVPGRVILTFGGVSVHA